MPGAGARSLFLFWVAAKISGFRCGGCYGFAVWRQHLPWRLSPFNGCVKFEVQAFPDFRMKLSDADLCVG